MFILRITMAKLAKFMFKTCASKASHVKGHVMFFIAEDKKNTLVSIIKTLLARIFL